VSETVTPNREARKLRSVARAALVKHGLTVVKLSFLAGCKQPAFRVRVSSRGIQESPGAHYDENTMLLRIFPGGTRAPAVIRSELQWLGSILMDTRLVVPKPVLTREGDSVVAISAPGDARAYHCALTSWVKGRLYLRKGGPGPRALRLVGMAMAQIHIHGQQFRRGAAFRCPRWDWQHLFGERSPYFPGAEKEVLRLREQRLYSRVIGQCRAAMDRLGTGRDVFGLVHGDLIQLNYLFYKGDVRIIDFGDFGCAHYIYDMAVTLFALLDLDPDGAQRRAFIEGYRELRCFPEEHKNMLDVFLAARGVLLSRSVIGAAGGQLSKSGARYIARVMNGIRSWAKGF
jgi:Ser/Thr protein kinase RdoA (MazF antagonist)